MKRQLLLVLSIVLISSVAYCEEKEIMPEADFIKNICTIMEEENEISKKISVKLYKKVKKVNAIQGLYVKTNGLNKMIKINDTKEDGLKVIFKGGYISKIDKEFNDYMKNIVSPIINKNSLHYNIQLKFEQLMSLSLEAVLQMGSPKVRYEKAILEANDDIFIVKDDNGKKIASKGIDILENYEALYDLFAGYIKKIDPNFKFTGGCAK